MKLKLLKSGKTWSSQTTDSREENRLERPRKKPEKRKPEDSLDEPLQLGVVKWFESSDFSNGDFANE